ncbi:hypothetical protein HOD75_03850 [archaeon]|mgnify:CR=1 FL=1|jgi:hypothetical protein|nr:hypothetical protein [archaeon]MBT4242004.1 hypothetical protein [archaeon]MBT4418551.1 hypothetical protein [archaeon]
MKEKIVTIGTLLEKGLIKESTKIRISIENLKEIDLIKPLDKKKVVKITELDEMGLIKK